MDEKQKEGFRALEKSGYLKQVREFAMARCVPFFWSSQEPGQPPRLLHNGTICYVDTGQRQIGITNNHVYQQYIDDLANFPNVEAQFNGNPVITQALSDARRRVNKELAHLTTERISGSPLRKQWDFTGLAQELKSQLQDFVARADSAKLSPRIKTAIR
jgi:hypothetical protein